LLRDRGGSSVATMCALAIASKERTSWGALGGLRGGCRCRRRLGRGLVEGEDTKALEQRERATRRRGAEASVAKQIISSATPGESTSTVWAGPRWSERANLHLACKADCHSSTQLWSPGALESRSQPAEETSSGVWSRELTTNFTPLTASPRFKSWWAHETAGPRSPNLGTP
jgi:hypothetical protein